MSERPKTKATMFSLVCAHMDRKPPLSIIPTWKQFRN